MKRIIIIYGGSRKTFNTASMLKKFAEGANSVSEEIEVKSYRLYEIDYKGCMSCMACKIKGKAVNICKFKDGLTPILNEIAEADGLVLGHLSFLGILLPKVEKSTIGKYKTSRLWQIKQQPPTR